jgi:hypothetical protein
MRRHPFDPVSFVFGVAFTALAVTGLAGVRLRLPEDLTLAGPVALVVLGLLVLLLAARPREQRAAEPEHGQLAAEPQHEPTEVD